MPGQVRDVHEAINEFNKRPSPLPNGPRSGGSRMINGTTASRHSQGTDDHSSESSLSLRDDTSTGSGSMRLPPARPLASYSIDNDDGSVNNLQSLSRRQEDLALKMLVNNETVPSPKPSRNSGGITSPNPSRNSHVITMNAR